MMTQTAPQQLSFLAQYVLGQLISSADEDRRAKLNGKLPDLLIAAADGPTDMTVIAGEIFSHTFKHVDGKFEYRFSAFESFECHADGRLSATLTREFLIWPGKNEFLEIFKRGIVKH